MCKYELVPCTAHPRLHSFPGYALLSTQIILFTIIYIQRQIFHNLSYVYWVSATFSKQGRRNRARAAGARHAAHIMVGGPDGLVRNFDFLLQDVPCTGHIPSFLVALRAGEIFV